MADGILRTYPAKLLLAHDDRMHSFLDASVLRDWNEAVHVWRLQKEAGAASQKQGSQSPWEGPVRASQPAFFSDEDFFSLTQQLEDITAVLVGHSARPPVATDSINVNSNQKTTAPSTSSTTTTAAVRKKNNIDGGSSPSSNTTLNVFALDEAMYATPLDAEQRRRCQLATEAYHRGEYSGAAETFSEVIDSCLPSVLNAALLGNRAACYLRNENYKLCLRDATRSYEMDDRYVPGIRRAIRSHLCCGRCAEARMIIEKYKKICDCSFELDVADISLYELYSTFLDRNEHATALRHLNELLKSVACANFEALKVQLLAVEEGNQAALAYAGKCLQQYSVSPELLYWRAQLLFLESSSENELAAVQPLFGVTVPADYAARFRQANHRIQHCIDLCRELGSLHSRKEWSLLIELCSTALQRSLIGDRLRSMVLAKRARGFFEHSRLYECIDDINDAIRSISAGGERAQLLLLKALSEEKLARLSDAVRSAKLALQEHHTREGVEVLQRLCERQREFQRRKQQEERNGCSSRGGNPSEADRAGAKAGSDGRRRREKVRETTASRTVAELYAHLSLPDGAGVERVKKSYRTLAMRWHPDKWCGAPVQEQKNAEEKFKRLKTSYEELLRIIEG